MDWQKVEKALDDEWERRRRLADFAKTPGERDHQDLLAEIAMMLRDAIAAGLKN